MEKSFKYNKFGVSVGLDLQFLVDSKITSESALKTFAKGKSWEPRVKAVWLELEPKLKKFMNHPKEETAKSPKPEKA